MEGEGRSWEQCYCDVYKGVYCCVSGMKFFMCENTNTLCILYPYTFPSTSIYLLNEDQATNGGQTFLIALVNALIVVAIVVVMTIILVLLFKYRCYKVSSPHSQVFPLSWFSHTGENQKLDGGKVC